MTDELCREDVIGRLIRLEEHRTKTDGDMAMLIERFMKHMDKEEAAFDNLYKRLRNLDTEITQSFKERDGHINRLDKQQVKMMAYATAAFAIISIVVQYGMRHI